MESGGEHGRTASDVIYNGLSIAIMSITGLLVGIAMHYNAGFLVLIPLVYTVALTTVSPLPAQPLDGPLLVPASVRPEPASAVVSSGDPESTVRISVGKPTWVFIRYPDNRVVDRKLAAGEELEVGPLPVFLAVGTAEAVEVRVENRPVALGPYIRNGQVRLTKPDLARLVP